MSVIFLIVVLFFFFFFFLFFIVIVILFRFSRVGQLFFDDLNLLTRSSRQEGSILFAQCGEFIIRYSLTLRLEWPELLAKCRELVISNQLLKTVAIILL